MKDILDKIRKEDLSTAEFLNAKDSNTQANFPDTAMHIACWTGNVALIRTLMAAGARWDLPGKSKQTAKQEADHLMRGSPDEQYARKQIMELLSESMPPVPLRYRLSASVCVCVCVCFVLFVLMCAV